MKSSSLSIVRLLGMIAAFGVGIAALRSATQLAASLALSATLGALTVSGLAAVYRHGSGRAFWVGFSTCGWTYLVLCFAPWFEEHVGPSLVTTAALDFSYSRGRPVARPNDREALYHFGAENVRSAVGPGLIAPSEVWLTGEWTEEPRLERFDVVSVLSSGRYRKIGYSLFSLAFATLGGIASRRLYLTDARTANRELR